MNSYPDIAGALEKSLNLFLPPISVCISDEVPEGVPDYDGRAPAGCLFWQEAAKGPFATRTSHHELCAIGVHTHHMADPPASYEGELGDVLKTMAGMDYVREQDVLEIPVLENETRHVIYAPLDKTPLEPTVVLLFAHARQSLIITEAVQQVEPAVPPAMGRPACAVVPRAVRTGRAALSLGCCGARAYLDSLTDDVAIWALPGDKVNLYAARIDILARANAVLGEFHSLRRNDVEAGLEPTIAESLSRLGS
ncbi:MAG: DUF169 domain-containing protein [Gemmatimonadota bacterium]|nr:DUF169 domain-containing protein [Gemmatimonadota bacterium]